MFSCIVCAANGGMFGSVSIAVFSKKTKDADILRKRGRLHGGEQVDWEVSGDRHPAHD
jgi:hypothetical protein